MIKWRPRSLSHAPSFRFYKVCFRIAQVLFGMTYRISGKGQENIPPGATMVCANHSSLMDPIFVALVFGIDHFLHYIAKIELFRIPLLSAVVTKLGAISVDREISDITTIKKTLTYFRNGEKVVIFPEGTRTRQGETVEIKPGAVRVAERAGVPLVPVFIPRKKKLFGKVSIVIGQPYIIEKKAEKRRFEDYATLSEELMSKIEALGPEL